jgi:hypothetical protein
MTPPNQCSMTHENCRYAADNYSEPMNISLFGRILYTNLSATSRRGIEGGPGHRRTHMLLLGHWVAPLQLEPAGRRGAARAPARRQADQCHARAREEQQCHPFSRHARDLARYARSQWDAAGPPAEAGKNSGPARESLPPFRASAGYSAPRPYERPSSLDRGPAMPVANCSIAGAVQQRGVASCSWRGGSGWSARAT